MHVTLTLLIFVVASVTRVLSDQENSNLTPNATNYIWPDWWQQIFVPRPSTTVRPVQPDTPSVPLSCPSSCDCGLTNKQHRIVGGVETQVNEYPWMALLFHKGRFYCGASVINSRYVLTAAHCVVDRFEKNSITVRILEHDRNSTNESEVQNFQVEEIIRHGDYSTLNYDNDIALIKIVGQFKFQGKMRPVCLPEKSKTFSGMTGVVTGWGAIEQSGPVSSVLREVMVPIMSNAECRTSRYPARRITDNMLCAGYKEGSKDSCQGDSGGPLHIKKGRIHQIAGVVSWGEGCAQPNYPGVYARVNRYLTWIDRNTADACYCSL
ncbi:trypsin-1-like [Leptopilina heterotoma]|uniref:trypsin-1-like n=1 Tax=Leptopilina heterotoma TaxID=63436 RepID=UPI001CA857CC|nr:trypsin-1-like [Leptopilina heterotoma]